MPVVQFHMAIAAPVGIDDGFKRGCGRRQDNREFSDGAIEHGHVAGVVGDAVVLLVGAFMFLIDNDEAQLFPWQEKSGAGADDYFCLAASNAAPDAFAFAGPQVGMPLGGLAGKAGFNAGDESSGERNFGKQQEYLPAGGESRRHGFEINLGLAGTGDAIKEHDPGAAGSDDSAKLLGSELLLLGQREATGVQVGQLESFMRGKRHDFQGPFLGHGFYHRGANAGGLGQFRQAHGKAFSGHIKHALALGRHAADCAAGGAVGNLPLCFLKGAGAAQHHAQHIALRLDVIVGQPIHKFAVDSGHGRHVETGDNIAELGAFRRLGFQSPDDADEAAGAKRHGDIATFLQHHSGGNPVGIGALQGQRQEHIGNRSGIGIHGSGIVLDGRACQSYITRAMKHTTVQPTQVHAREIVYWEPIQLAQRLRGQAFLTLFESTMRQEKLGRYSFLACNPASTLKVENGRTLLDGVVQEEAPLAVMDKILSRNRLPKLAGLPPFQGGLAGYIGYDFGRSLEPHTRLPEFPALCPELMLHVYDVGIAFDHLQERAWIISTAGEPPADELEELLKRKAQGLGSPAIENWSSNFTRESYEAAVTRTIEYILAGDIFQANISQCFSAAIPEGFEALAFYKRLRSLNPATFSAYLDYGDVQIASSSPERLLSFDGMTVEARPIKGTRRRDPNPALDAALVAELSSSRKDRAENVMIVDLLRNDLSRVCAPGSVRVPVLCGLESYASVHHLTSVVTGVLKPDKTVGDLIAAVFPGGSITGAPKIRAMEVIAEIEGQGRGIYCGSIGYFGFNGQVDLSIAIRTAMFSQGTARFQGGGGITARSEPAAEYEESLTKISRIMEAFAT